MDPLAQTRSESFAAYLAKALIAKKGYRAGTVPEAQELFGHCDTVLTRADGMSLSIVAIVDREAGPSRRFSLSKEELDRIGTACLRYSGRAGFRRLPVSIMIVEAGAEPLPADETARLASLKARTPFSKVLISAFAPDTSTQEVWTNSPLRGRMMRSFMRSLMEKPRLSDFDLAPKPHAVIAGRRPLILTYSILGMLAVIFASEYFFRVSPPSGLLDPSIKTLIALGALDKSLVTEGGQWWRLFSAPLLHGGLVHIALNGVALFFAGAVLENVIGRAWFAAIFALSAVTGAALSLFINPPALISVGASGAIMGLFAAAFAVSYRYPTASPMRTFLQSGSLRVLIPSMLPLFDGLFGQKVDYAAHLGGAIGGVAAGGFLIAVWAHDARLPPFRLLAWSLAAAFLCGALYSGVQIEKGYAQYDLDAYLIPAEKLPKDAAAWKSQSAQLVQSYPRDPRSHVYRALALMDAGDAAGAEREWRAALEEDKMLRFLFKPQLEEFIRANLASTLKQSGKEAEARAVARPVCSNPGEIRDEIAKEGLCP